MSLLKKLDHFMDLFLRIVCVTFLLVLFLLLSLNVFFRYVPIYSIGWFDEIVELSFASLSFFGAAFLWRRGEHSRIDFISEKFMGTKVEIIIELIISIIGLIFVYFMVRYSLVLISKTTAWSAIFKIPRKVFYAGIPISGIIMAIYSIRDIVKHTKRLLLFKK